MVQVVLTNEEYKEKFDKALQGFLRVANTEFLNYWRRYFKSPCMTEIVSLTGKSKKYLKVVSRIRSEHGFVSDQVSAYAFIDKQTGDIYMPASWQRPSKHIKGNIFVGAGRSAISSRGSHIKYYREAGLK